LICNKSLTNPITAYLLDPVNTRHLIKAIQNPTHALYKDEVIEKLVPKGRKHLALISSPKSGSTWLNYILDSLLGWKELHMLPHFGRREQELDLHRLLLSDRDENIFTPGVHTRYNKETMNILNIANSKTIFQFRSIFDMVVSFRDHMNRESVRWPMAYMDKKNWALLDETKQLDFVIEMVVPWYYNFYCGWMSSDIIKERKRSLIITYEAMKKDTIGEIRRVCKFVGEKKTDKEIEAAMAASNKKNFRKNKGIVGRGKQQLNEEQIEKIISYTNFYPTIDFSLLGIKDEKIPGRTKQQNSANRVRKRKVAAKNSVVAETAV